MNMLTRALALVTGISLLAGCDSMYKQWATMGQDHRPSVKTGYIKGKVVDALGEGIAGAQVSNGASVYFTSDGTGTVTDDAGNSLTLTKKGEFVLTKVHEGIQYVTATYDGVKSQPTRIYVQAKTFDQNALNASSDPNSTGEVAITTNGPVTADSTALRLIQITPTTLEATFSVVASDSMNPADTVYGTPDYGTAGRDVVLSIAAPPNGSGDTVRSFAVEYEDPAIPTYAMELTPTVTISPGSKTSSGPITNVLIKKVGPNTADFARVLEASRSIEATITLYNSTTQSAATQLIAWAPTKDKRDATASFEAKVILEIAE